MSTSRLKRKAAEDDTLQNNNLDESFVQFGTALPSLASTKKDQGEYVPVWKQEVRDEQGRRRLHGAFTGGFSAGYFNTAGSKEGWTPSTFVSQKDAKGKGRAQQRPEDFMDEEDLAELKASRTFKASEGYVEPSKQRPEDAFAGLGTTTSARAPSSAATDPQYADAVANSLLDLVKPGSRRIGQKIMAKMGWRPGQGVGPRLSYARRQEQMRELGLLTAAEDNQEEVDEEAAKHTFAPIDRSVLTFDNKDNQWGLGFTRGDSLASQAMSERSTAVPSFSLAADADERFRRNSAQEAPKPQNGRSHMPVGGAFGISALEDADEDDADVYGSGLSNAVNKVLQDGDEDEDEPSFLNTSRRPELMRRGDGGRNHSKAEVTVKPAQHAKQERFNDGSPVLSGFKLASRSQPPDKWFPAPPLPKNWQPNPKAIWARGNLEAISAAASSSANIPAPQKKGQQNMLAADDRARMLGEPVAPKSVFDYLSAKSRERLQDLSKAAERPPSAAAEGPGATAPDGGRHGHHSETLSIPEIDSKVAQAALQGFMPYGDDLPRQARYKTYLQHFALPRDPNRPFMPKSLPNRSTGDLNRELDHFASAARVFKPMSGMMANRFTSGTSQGTLLNIKAPEAGLHVPKPPVPSTSNIEDESARKMQEQMERELADPRKAAVREGNFGPLTRTIEPWSPIRLLCKRFNVADPYPNGPPADNGSSNVNNATPTADPLDANVMENLMQERRRAGDQGNATSTPFGSANHAANNEEIAQVPDEDVEQTVDVEPEKPSMDIFKAIFASDDEEEEAGDDELEEVNGEGAEKSKPVLDMVEDPSAPPDTTSLAPKQREVAANPMTTEELATFKPTFVSRAERLTDRGGAASAKSEEARKRKKSKKAAVLSFAMEDGEGEEPPTSLPAKKRKSADKKEDARKRQKDDGAQASKANGPTPYEDDADEWVEKDSSNRLTKASSAQPAIETTRKHARVTASELF